MVELNEKKALIAILVAALVFRLVLSQAAPIWGGPDEPSHYNFIVQLEGEKALTELTQEDVAGTLNYVSIYQPPLYYLANSFLYSPIKGLPVSDIIHLLRLFNVLAGTAGVFLVYKILKLVSGNKGTILLTTAIVALLPTHIVVSSTVNNAPLDWLFVLLSAYFFVLALRKGFGIKQVFLAQLFFGLAVITKFLPLSLLPLVLLFDAWFFRESAEKAVKKLAACIVPFLIFGPILLRNFLIYGSFIVQPAKSISGLSLELFVYDLTRTFAGVWVQEYGVAFIPNYRIWFFALFGLITLFSALGIAFLAWQRRQRLLKMTENALSFKKTELEKREISLVFLGVAFLLSFASFTYLNTSWFFPDARLFFETIAFAMLFLVIGQKGFWKAVSMPKGASYSLSLLLICLLYFDLVLLINHYTVLPQVPWPIP